MDNTRHSDLPGFWRMVEQMKTYKEKALLGEKQMGVSSDKGSPRQQSYISKNLGKE